MSQCFGAAGPCCLMLSTSLSAMGWVALGWHQQANQLTLYSVADEIVVVLPAGQRGLASGCMCFLISDVSV